MKTIYSLTVLIILVFASATTLKAGDRQIRRIIKAIHNNDMAGLKKSLNKITNINEGVRDSNGGSITPLLAAVFYDNEEACRILIENGAAIWVEYKDGLTIFDFAMKTEVPTIRQLFIDAKNN